MERGAAEGGQEGVLAGGQVRALSGRRARRLQSAAHVADLLGQGIFGMPVAIPTTTTPSISATNPIHKLLLGRGARGGAPPGLATDDLTV